LIGKDRVVLGDEKKKDNSSYSFWWFWVNGDNFRKLKLKLEKISMIYITIFIMIIKSMQKIVTLNEEFARNTKKIIVV
jgi:hypothetical protein